MHSVFVFCSSINNGESIEQQATAGRPPIAANWNPSCKLQAASCKLEKPSSIEVETRLIPKLTPGWRQNQSGYYMYGSHLIWHLAGIFERPFLASVFRRNYLIICLLNYFYCFWLLATAVDWSLVPHVCRRALLHFHRMIIAHRQVYSCRSSLPN